MRQNIKSYVAAILAVTMVVGSTMSVSAESLGQGSET